MATATPTQSFTPDTVLSFEIRPGTLGKLVESLGEGGPRLKCFEGSVTLVSPGLSHETMSHRLVLVIAAICNELDIKHQTLGSTQWTLIRMALS